MTARLIEHKWATLILRELLAGKQRYSALQRALPGISAKMLSERLRDFERQGIVIRTVYPTVPPSTDYELTALGHTLEDVIAAMARFGERLHEARQG